MNVLSLFSGAGGLDLGLERAGHRIIGHCEIDPTARAVLDRQWAMVPCHDDVTTLDGKAWRGRVDLVAGGSPCQDLSVAGRRAGLGGERSGLFWHQCRVATECAARWVLWENVAGALSSNDGEDFAAVLWGLTGFRPAVPEDGWRTFGVCVGPNRTAVWRLLDARYFGVAQRRRRVFVVAGPRTECEPEVLAEPESVRRDSRPSRTEGEGSTVGTLTTWSSGGWHVGVVEAAAGHLIRSTFDWQASADRQSIIDREDGPTRTLDSKTPAVAYPLAMRGRQDGAEMELGEPDVYNSLRAGDGGSSRQNAGLTPNLTVRRLTPRECERLMGWPDDWTRWRADGTEIADSHRYRLCGNGVVSAVTEWIGRRLAATTAREAAA